MKPRPWIIDVPRATLDRIHTGLQAAHVGYPIPDRPAWADGTDARYLGEFLEYWRDTYNWSEQQDRLNQLPHFVVDIDGQRVHYLHLRSGAAVDPSPIILTHGWPGSFIEFEDAAPLLVAQGYDVVVPSLPGFGFSGAPAQGFSSPRAIAGLWRRLMIDVLGYPSFGAQGGDVGSYVTTWLAHDHADVVTAIHLNLFDGPAPSERDDKPTVAWRHRKADLMRDEAAYGAIHWTKPQTIGLALAASPLAFASWVLEKFYSWSDHQGDLSSCFSKNQLISNLMIYLTTDSVQSSIWLYRSFLTESTADITVKVPTGLSLYPKEFFTYPPRSAAERKYTVSRWSEQPAGGHFAAMEVPELFAADVGGFFESASTALRPTAVSR